MSNRCLILLAAFAASMFAAERPAGNVGPFVRNGGSLAIQSVAQPKVRPIDIRAVLATDTVGKDPDDPAIWVHPSEPARSLILATDKTAAPAGAVFVFGLDGKIRQKVPGLDRPNNIDVEYGLRVEGRPVDIAVVTERYQRRLRVFRIAPDGSGISDISSPGQLGFLAGAQGEAGAPMGIALYKRPRDGAVFAIVAPKEGPREGYLAQYRLEDDGEGRVRSTLVRRFGRFSGTGEIEAVAVDDALGYVYYADEGDGIHKYHADPDHPDAARELAHFGRDGFTADREGIAIYARTDGTGYIVCTDQIEGSSNYHIYRREGAPGRPHDHSELLKTVRGGADSTDGLEITSANLGSRFPNGMMVAMNSAPRNFLVFNWEDIATAGSPGLSVASAGPASIEALKGPARVKAVDSMARRPGANLNLLFRLAAEDPDPAVRGAIVDRLGRQHGIAGVSEMLERRAVSDPDAGISLLALERLRTQQAHQLGLLFEKRIESARTAKDAQALKSLAAEAQRWASHAKGATIPAFMQEPPPVFEAIPARESIRVLAFSDFGTGNADMKKTAAAMRAYHRSKPFDMGITLGDNIPSDGVTSTTDPRWKEIWEDNYNPLGIPIFASTGNHDWGYAESPAAQILYSRNSRTWRMPALYYTFTAGPIQFFALATNAMSEAQIEWLGRELSRSTARWKIVYGHHPIFSHGSHGNTAGFDKALLPVLKGRAQIYLVGHDHTPQHLKPEGGVHFFLNPAAGQGSRPAYKGDRTLYTGSYHGFSVIEADANALAFRFVDAGGEVRYQTTLK